MKKTTDIEASTVRAIENEDWWSSLPPEMQREAKSLDDQLVLAITGYIANRTVIGRCLTQAHKVFTPHGLFHRFMRRYFRGISRSTGVRIMKQYVEMAKEVPEVYVNKGIEMGADLADPRTLAKIHQFPPPKKATPENATKWIKEVMEVRLVRKHEEGEVTVPIVDEDELMKDAAILYRRRFQKVSEAHAVKYAEKFCGLVLTMAGVTKPTTIKPLPVPAAWSVPRGRPKAEIAA